MDFKASFTKPKGAKVTEPEEKATGTPDAGAEGRTPDELGSALKEAMDAGDGMSICEAVKAIMTEYKE